MKESTEELYPESQQSINQRIAARVRGLRTELGLSLDELAQRCQVSRSMISLVERGESSPTAVVLEKLASGLGVALASLFDPLGAPNSNEGPVTRLAQQTPWQDPASGYLRRNVSPLVALGGLATPVQIVEVRFPPKASVMYESAVHAQRPERMPHQQIWMLEGRMQITLGEEVFDLKVGDCLAHQLDRPIAYHNPTRQTTRYAVVITTR